jgi:hypothetical protein
MTRNIQPDPYEALGADDWWYPEVLTGDPSRARGPVLSEAQLSRFHNDGFIVVTGLWPAETIDVAAAEARTLHPAEQIIRDARAGKYHRTRTEMPWTQQGDAAPDATLNHMTIHPRALHAIAQLLGSDPIDIRLSQSHVIAKHGQLIDRPGHPSDGTISGDQDIHVDYGNNTLMVPPRTAKPEAVACLCYYCDVGSCGGATHFAKALPGELTSYNPDSFNPPNFVAGTKNGSAAAATGPRSPENTARLYHEEKPVHYQPGTCILYKLNTWHRGTPAALGKVRHSHHHVWRHRHAEWVNWQSLAPAMAAMPTRFLSDLSVLQRTVLGFAPPGDVYWTDETVDAVGQRYPEMDMTPYRAAMARTLAV